MCFRLLDGYSKRQYGTRDFCGWRRVPFLIPFHPPISLNSFALDLLLFEILAFLLCGPEAPWDLSAASEDGAELALGTGAGLISGRGGRCCRSVDAVWGLKEVSTRSL
jgi:hypothetical protein